MADLISHSEAARIAAGWGSYMTAGDPGAIFYGFDGRTVPDWDHETWERAKAYCEKCITHCKAKIADPEAHGCNTDPESEYFDDLDQDLTDLDELHTYIIFRGGASAHIDDRETTMGEIRMMMDGGDPWGSTMGAWFALVEEMHFNRPKLTVPEKYQFRPSPMGFTSDLDDYMTTVAASATDESLVYCAETMHRYATKLQNAGQSY